MAIATANLSDKDDEYRDPLPEIKDDQKWLEKYNERQLKLYVDYEEKLIADSKEERSTASDYAGRWLLELLQNIDDALGPKDTTRYIGAKGLGFLSILEIAHLLPFRGKAGVTPIIE